MGEWGGGGPSHVWIYHRPSTAVHAWTKANQTAGEYAYVVPNALTSGLRGSTFLCLYPSDSRTAAACVL